MKFVIENVVQKPEPEIKLNLLQTSYGDFQLCGRLGTINWIIAEITQDGKVILNPAGCEQLGLTRT